MTLLAAIIAALAGLPILKQLIDVVNGSLDLTKDPLHNKFTRFAGRYHPTKAWRRGDRDRNGSHAAC